MKKSGRIEAYVGGLDLAPSEHPACYLAYFECFNAGDYYEAHDVLEHLWLGETGPDYAFYKGLIQIAGAFVHLKKQKERPDHPKDGRRLHPAFRLFGLGMKNITPFAPRRHGLDVDRVLALCREVSGELERSGFARNPWDPARRPQIRLDA